MPLPHPLLLPAYANASLHYRTKDTYAAPLGCQTIFILVLLFFFEVTKCRPNWNRDRYGLAYSSLSLMSPLDRHLFRSRRVKGCFWFYFSCHTFTNTFCTQQKYRDPGSMSSSYLCRMQIYCGPFVCATIPSTKSNVGRNGNHPIVAFCNFRWPL